MPSDSREAGASDPVTILYTNWRGETAVRRIALSTMMNGTVGLSLFFGSSEWHPEPQWLLRAWDAEKGAHRDFALSGIKAWGQEAVDAALAPPPPAAVPESVRGLADRLRAWSENDPDPDHFFGGDGAVFSAMQLDCADASKALANSPPSGRAAEGGDPNAPASAGRCPVCDWPLATRREDGCVLGDCSYRPEEGSPEFLRIQARRMALATAPTTPETKATLGVEPGETAFRAYYAHGGASWESLSRLGRQQWTRVEVALARRARPKPEPAAGGEDLEYPAGAIHNGREFLRRLGESYAFECEAGNLAFCSEYQEAVRCFEVLVEYVEARSILSASTADGETAGDGALEWAVTRWRAEVENRPLQNVHRRALDTTWRQVIRRFGGDPDALVGPSHDALIDATRPDAGADAQEGR